MEGSFRHPHYAVATEGYGLSSLIGVLADIHGDLQAWTPWCPESYRQILA